jgi:ribose-phosphate pyrophosphokinase
LKLCRSNGIQLAEACRRTHNGESVSFLFKHAPVD